MKKSDEFALKIYYFFNLLYISKIFIKFISVNQGKSRLFELLNNILTKTNVAA